MNLSELIADLREAADNNDEMLTAAYCNSHDDGIAARRWPESNVMREAATEIERYINGELIVIPKNKLHAEALIAVSKAFFMEES